MKNEPDEPAEERPLILVVEDDLDFLTFIASELEESYRVISAPHGREGLRLAREQIPDLVVTDLMMPIMGGVELCHELKESTETSHIPVIILSAKVAVESQIKGLKTGADDYITKPMVTELFLAKIHNLLEMRRLMREKFSREFKFSTKPSIESSPDQAFLKKALEVLQAHYMDHDFTAETFAEKLNISLRSLHRKLKALTGQTPSKMIWNARLQQAASLLRSSGLRITEIAFEVGYTDSGHFSRRFRDYYGVSPSEYRIDTSSNGS